MDVFPDGVGFGVMDGLLFVLVALLCPHCLQLCAEPEGGAATAGRVCPARGRLAR